MAAVRISRTHQVLVGVVVTGAVVIAGIGFAGSYAAVRELALRKGFGWFANVFPIGIDAGIVVLLALDLLLTWLRIPFPLLRHTAWLLTAATIAFNAAAAWPDPLGVGMHGIIPVLFVVSVEAARHAIGRLADITADRHMESVRIARWLLAPVPTFRLWRRMKLWELRSYDEVIRLEQERLVYQARLRARYGRGWRRRAPVEVLMPLRLARFGLPLSESAAYVPDELSVTGPEPPRRTELTRAAETTGTAETAETAETVETAETAGVPEAAVAAEAAATAEAADVAALPGTYAAPDVSAAQALQPPVSPSPSPSPAAAPGFPRPLPAADAAPPAMAAPRQTTTPPQTPAGQTPGQFLTGQVSAAGPFPDPRWATDPAPRPETGWQPETGWDTALIPEPAPEPVQPRLTVPNGNGGRRPLSTGRDGEPPSIPLPDGVSREDAFYHAYLKCVAENGNSPNARRFVRQLQELYGGDILSESAVVNDLRELYQRYLTENQSEHIP